MYQKDGGRSLFSGVRAIVMSDKARQLVHHACNLYLFINNKLSLRSLDNIPLQSIALRFSHSNGLWGVDGSSRRRGLSTMMDCFKWVDLGRPLPSLEIILFRLILLPDDVGGSSIWSDRLARTSECSICNLASSVETAEIPVNELHDILQSRILARPFSTYTPECPRATPLRSVNWFRWFPVPFSITSVWVRVDALPAPPT